MTSRIRATTATRKPLKLTISLPTSEKLKKLLLCIAKYE